MSFPVENRIDEFSHNVTQEVYEKVILPATVPYDLKVPIPTLIPVENEEEDNFKKPTLIE